MKGKLNKELLNEELKRFKLLNEYDFYVGEDEEIDDVDNLILGEEGEEEEDDLGLGDIEDDSKTAASDDGEDMESAEDDLEVDIETDGDEDVDLEAGDEFGDELGDESELDMEPAEDEVELDVTQLVQGSEEAKASADSANQKIDQLMGMIDNLEGKLNSMDSITSKIDNLENELEKRAPTPEEKLEMRSLDSFPYNLKLTDFWSDKKGQYDVMGTDEEDENEEYVLTQKDVEEEYNETQVKASFNENPYEEEDF